MKRDFQQINPHDMVIWLYQQHETKKKLSEILNDFEQFATPS